MRSLTTWTDTPVASVTLRASGYCVHPEFVTIRGGSLRKARFPAGYAWIDHPRLGIVLFDTGYAERFCTETARWPASIYAALTPVFIGPEDSAVKQLASAGIAPEQVKHIVISHFHGDHIAGLRDFPAAEFHYLPAAYEAVRSLTGLAAVRAAYLPGLLPDRFEQRSRPLTESSRRAMPTGCPWADGYDVFGDGSLIAVDVSGHAAGQLGLFVSTADTPYFLCADAVWSSRAIREARPPHPVARLIMNDSAAYDRTFRQLQQLARTCPELLIVPSHCEERFADTDSTTRGVNA